LDSIEYRTTEFTEFRYRYLKIYYRPQKELNDNEEKTDTGCWNRHARFSLDFWFICVLPESR
jgi:hypothetical protein